MGREAGGRVNGEGGTVGRVSGENGLGRRVGGEGDEAGG